MYKIIQDILSFFLIADTRNILQEDLEGRKIHKTNKNKVKANSSIPFHCSIPLIPDSLLFLQKKSCRVGVLGWVQ